MSACLLFEEIDGRLAPPFGATSLFLYHCMFLSKRLQAVDCLGRPRCRTFVFLYLQRRAHPSAHAKKSAFSPNLANTKSTPDFVPHLCPSITLWANKNPAFTISHSAFGITSARYAGGKKKCVVLVHDEESPRLILAASIPIPVRLGATKQGMLLALGLRSGVYVLT